VRTNATFCGAILSLALSTALSAADNSPASIVEAAKSGDTATLRSLIQKKSDVNAPDGDGSTALHWASYRDNLEAADLLIRAGAKVNTTNDLGVTPLWPASENGSSKMVRRLLEAGADPNSALVSGETPLMAAARSGYPDVVEQLLAKGASINARGTRGQTALMWAAAQGHPNVVKVLLAHRADIRLKSDTWTDVMAVPPHGYLPYNKAVPHGGETALMFAARNGDIESSKLLVAAGANVNDTDAWGVSATTLAAHSGFTDIVLFLLDRGADPNVEGPGFTALHEAIERRDEKMVAALLDHGANPDTPLKTWTPTRRSSDDWYFDPMLVGATPYWLAARFTEPDIMRVLTKHGADPLFVHHADYTAEQGFGAVQRKETATTLMAATGSLRVHPWVELPAREREAATLEAVKIAVESGVDLNVANTDGRTALDGAKALGYNSVVAYLTEKGAKAGTGGSGAGRSGRGGGRPLTEPR
jgi:ankyrin repeat protein